MKNLIGNGGIDEEEEVVQDKRKRKEDNKEEKGRESIGEKRNDVGKKRREK